jgi:predicted hydrocarbon binding protein
MVNLLMALINGLDLSFFFCFWEKYDLAVLEWESMDDLLWDSKIKVLLYFLIESSCIWKKREVAELIQVLDIN